MPLNKHNCRVFHRTLFAGILETVTLLKRNDDQQENVVQSYVLFQCLLPDNQISGDFVGASKTRYSGEAVKLQTLSGTQLGVTVNHPVLTPGGFVKAGRLKPGDDVVCEQINTGSTSTKIKDRPSFVGDVFQSLSEKLGVFTSSKVAPFEFLGDGQFLKGEIDVVGSNRELLENRNTSASKLFCDSNLNGLYSQASLKNCNRVPNLICSRPFASQGSQISCFGLIPSLFGSQASCFDLISLTARPSNHTSFSQHPMNSFFVYVEKSGKRSRALARQIPTANLIRRQVGVSSDSFGYTSASESDAGSLESISQRVEVNAGHLGNISDTMAGKVKIDKLIKIHRFHYDGPVYDFATKQGYYKASSTGDKIYVSNCRRSLITKTGEPIQNGMLSEHRTVWHIPRIVLDQVGVRYLNPADRIVDKEGRYWQPESTTVITEKLFSLHIDLECLRIDPPPIPGAAGIE